MQMLFFLYSLLNQSQILEFDAWRQSNFVDATFVLTIGVFLLSIAIVFDFLNPCDRDPPTRNSKTLNSSRMP